MVKVVNEWVVRIPPGCTESHCPSCTVIDVRPTQPQVQCIPIPTAKPGECRIIPIPPARPGEVKIIELSARIPLGCGAVASVRGDRHA